VRIQGAEGRGSHGAEGTVRITRCRGWFLRDAVPTCELCRCDCSC
jgi:hypothetical protein